ncbi:hypothetical protein [Bacillus salipaludis]|nr:hypothetical protein [Bacillus salipaludis]
MEKEKILNHLDHAIEKQVPDVWDEIKNRVHKMQELKYDSKGNKIKDNS